MLNEYTIVLSGDFGDAVRFNRTDKNATAIKRWVSQSTILPKVVIYKGEFLVESKKTIYNAKNNCFVYCSGRSLYKLISKLGLFEIRYNGKMVESTITIGSNDFIQCFKVVGSDIDNDTKWHIRPKDKQWFFNALQKMDKKSAGTVVMPDPECPFKRNIVYAFEKLADDVFYFSRQNSYYYFELSKRD